MLAFKYIAFHYLKYFVVIMVALIFFMVGFEYMESADRLPDSANLVLLFLMFKAFFAIDMLLPLSLIFAMIATKIFLIRSNALVALYSLGYSKTDVLKPFVVVSTVIIFIFIALHATSFARADEYSNNIRKSAQFVQPTSNLFFTFSDQYVYFGRLFPLQQRAEDIRIFNIDKGSMTEVLIAEEAIYSDGYWYIASAHLMRKPKDFAALQEGVTIEELKDLKLLKDFKPKILDQVYEGKVNFTIIDAFDAIRLLNEQNISIDRIKSALYKIFIYPFFVPCLVVIIFFFVPISPRFLNVTLFSFGAILATLVTWSVLFTMIELSNTKTIPSEVGIIVPVVVLFIAAVIQWRRNRIRT